MSDEQPSVPIFCEACDTTTRVPLDDVGEAVDRHNEQLHDGEEMAQVDPDIADHLADLIVDDLGLLDEE
ncbi:hypothetical protein [Halorientalis halophila]|uniref:hypothetical protein n=1 Tax=Halorientalis halophila TaxID=3108499 RepID=UPI00300B1AB8